MTTGIAITAAPASATVTTLCVGYTGCAKAGMSNAGYATAGKSMYWRMYAGHNCTNYAAYRMVKSGLPNSRPWTGSGNATNWGGSMGSKTNSTPKVGAVAWWRAGVYPAGSAGHVAYVEKVVSPDEIIVSMDSWHGDFSWARITRASKGWPSGFIHFNDVHITSTAAPKITGTPKVGSQLTATAGTWSVSGTSYAYQWLADNAPVTGATSSTLTATQAMKGKALSVKVTAKATGYNSASATSTPTAAVQPGVITNTASPTISGDPRVDSTLAAHPGSWDPSSATLSYRWKADGDYVPGATDSSLSVDPSMVGKAIRVEVTATKTGYTAVKALSAPTDAVAPGQLPATDPPNLTGHAEPGAALRLGSIPTPAKVTRTVRWVRGNKRVPGATAPTYHLSSADLGHRIRAVVTLERPGYEPMVLRTPWTRVVRTSPVIRLSTTPGHKRLAFRATVHGRGTTDVNGLIRVWSHGTLIREVRLRQGAASATLTGLKPGVRTYKFRVPADPDDGVRDGHPAGAGPLGATVSAAHGHSVPCSACLLRSAVHHVSWPHRSDRASARPSATAVLSAAWSRSFWSAYA